MQSILSNHLYCYIVDIFTTSYAKNILAISGIGENILSGILAEMGDISRFDNVKEIQKLSGLGLEPAVRASIPERPKSVTEDAKDSEYDPKKLLGDIVRPDQSIPQAA